MKMKPEKQRHWLQRLDERILALNSAGPALAPPGRMATDQDVIEMVSDDHRTLASQVLGDDGKWHGFMRAD